MDSILSCTLIVQGCRSQLGTDAAHCHSLPREVVVHAPEPSTAAYQLDSKNATITFQNDTWLCAGITIANDGYGFGTGYASELTAAAQLQHGLAYFSSAIRRLDRHLQSCLVAAVPDIGFCATIVHSGFALQVRLLLSFCHHGVGYPEGSSLKIVHVILDHDEPLAGGASPRPDQQHDAERNHGRLDKQLPQRIALCLSHANSTIYE